MPLTATFALRFKSCKTFSSQTEDLVIGRVMVTVTTGAPTMPDIFYWKHLAADTMFLQVYCNNGNRLSIIKLLPGMSLQLHGMAQILARRIVYTCSHWRRRLNLE